MSAMSQDKDDITLGHSEALKEQGIYTFMGAVEDDSIKPVIDWILYENFVVKRNKKKELLLMICSDGGELAPCFALIDVMKSSTIPIKTVGLGMIGSCGLLIFLTGNKGRRVLTPNTSILSHQFSWYNEGKAHELFATMREFELTQKRMVAHYKQATGMSESKIKEHLLPPQDVWLSAEESLELGICDAIAQTPR